MQRTGCRTDPRHLTAGAPRRYRIGVLVGVLLVLVSMSAPAWASGLLSLAAPNTRPCLAPAAAELVYAGTNARGERFFERRDSPMRARCQMLRQKTIARVLGDRIDFCKSSGEVRLRDTFAYTMQLPQGTEDEWVGEDFLFNEGCVPHDCGEKAFVVMEITGARGVVGLFSCVRPGDAAGHYDRVLYLFSDFPGPAAIPQAVRRRIEAWRAAVEREEQRSCRCPYPRISEMFVH